MTTSREGASAPSRRRVLNISAGQDTGGQIIRMKRAFDRHPTDWQMSALATSPTYIAYPVDISVPKTGRESRELMERLWVEADVVHVHRHLQWFSGFDRNDRRPIVFNNHGTAFRAEPDQMMREARHIGAVVVVSTIDLLQYARDLTWLPAPYQIDELQALRRKHKPRADKDRPIRIVHAPTDRAIKSTAAIVAAIGKLSQRHKIEFDLIEGVPWAECLRRKASADIVVDQLILGYGCNAIESWGMGVPVVAGTTDPKTRDAMIEILGELPFYEATEKNLVERLELLIAEKTLRTKYGQIGLAYAKRWHDDLTVMRQVEGLYERAIAERRPTPIARLSAAAPKNRIVDVVDGSGQIRKMTPARAQLRGFRILEATA